MAGEGIREITRWDVAREFRFWPWRVGAAAVAVVLVGEILSIAGADSLGLQLLMSGFLGLWGANAWWIWDRLARPLDSAQKVKRWTDHSNHNDGTASVWDIGQFASRWAMRRRAQVLRPSYWWLTRQAVRRIPVSQYAAKIALAGWRFGIFGGVMSMWSSCEDATLRLGGPRSGKTLSIAEHLASAPGPAVCTSTRADLLQHTHEIRASKGKVLIFNPTGLGGIESTIHWTPLSGCRDFATAQRRAESMIEDREGEGQTWAEQARRVLAVLLHAAAIGGHKMQKVATWISDPSPAHGEEIVATFRGAPTALVLVPQVRGFINTNDRTKTSITTTMAPAVSWLANDAAALIGDCPADEAWDVGRFVGSTSDTVYLIGSPETAPVTPLISALTSEIAHQLRMVAGATRLDPPMTMVLDEMALAIPQVPVADWTADMGGRGVTLHLSCQSLAQLRHVWGKDEASSLLTNSATLLVFGGVKDSDDLQALSKLAGQRLEVLDEDDARYTVVLDPARLNALGPGEVVIFARNLRPVIATAPRITTSRRPLQVLPKLPLPRVPVWDWIKVRSSQAMSWSMTQLASLASRAKAWAR